jgi:hypothetical protein
MPSRVNYEEYARYGNFRRVRLAAFKCLTNLLPLRPELLSTVLNLLEAERNTQRTLLLLSCTNNNNNVLLLLDVW